MTKKVIVDIGQAIQQLQANPRLGDELGKLLLKDVWEEAQAKALDATAFYPLVRSYVRSILENPLTHKWTVQGLGMVRANLDPAGLCRLNVWHGALRIPNISCIHTHPWDLKSHILSGTLTNVRYKDNLGRACDYDIEDQPETMTYYPAHGMKLGCGAHPNGAAMGEQFNITLYPQAPEEYGPGQCYVQGRDEIHESRFTDGAVTLNIRTNRREDQSATVFWPNGTPWVDAKQSMAEMDAVFMACDKARSEWWPLATLVA